MENERNGKYLETSVRVLQNVSTSIVVRGLDDLTFLATHSPAEFFVQKGKVCYESEDYHQAVMYFSQALRLDPQNAEAQFMMGAMYNSGQGVARDYVEAVKWFLNAAEQGHTQAQYNVGLMYWRGEGAPQDFVKAHMWLDLSAAQGDSDAKKYRDELAERMSPSQLAEAERLAMEWKHRGNLTIIENP